MIKPVMVKPLEDYKVYIEFSNGEKRIFDVKPYLSTPFYAPLENPDAFKKVFVNDITIQWANGRDISPHELFEYSHPCNGTPN